jgi:putative tryptophan/tyrosine transport system substrate-binding protein
MKRREFIALIGSAAAGWPFAAGAQQPQRMRRIAMLISTREDDAEGQARVALLRQGLKELGWTEARMSSASAKHLKKEAQSDER